MQRTFLEHPVVKEGEASLPVVPRSLFDCSVAQGFPQHHAPHTSGPLFSAEPAPGPPAVTDRPAETSVQAVVIGSSERMAGRYLQLLQHTTEAITEGSTKTVSVGASRVSQSDYGVVSSEKRNPDDSALGSGKPLSLENSTGSTTRRLTEGISSSGPDEGGHLLAGGGPEKPSKARQEDGQCETLLSEIEPLMRSQPPRKSEALANFTPSVAASNLICPDETAKNACGLESFARRLSKGPAVGQANSDFSVLGPPGFMHQQVRVTDANAPKAQPTGQNGLTRGDGNCLSEVSGLNSAPFYKGCAVTGPKSNFRSGGFGGNRFKLDKVAPQLSDGSVPIFLNAASVPHRLPAHKPVRLSNAKHLLAPKDTPVYFKYGEEHYPEETIPSHYTHVEKDGTLCRYITNFLVYNKRGERLLPIEVLDQPRCNGPVLYGLLLPVSSVCQSLQRSHVNHMAESTEFDEWRRTTTDDWDGSVQTRASANGERGQETFDDPLPGREVGGEGCGNAVVAGCLPTYPVRIELAEWCIDYGPTPSSEPSMWLMSRWDVYYRLEKPAGRYTSTFMSSKLKFEIATRILKSLQLNAQIEYKDLCDLLKGTQTSRSGQTEGRLKEEGAFSPCTAASLATEESTKDCRRDTSDVDATSEIATNKNENGSHRSTNSGVLHLSGGNISTKGLLTPWGAPYAVEGFQEGMLLSLSDFLSLQICSFVTHCRHAGQGDDANHYSGLWEGPFMKCLRKKTAQRADAVQLLESKRRALEAARNIAVAFATPSIPFTNESSGPGDVCIDTSEGVAALEAEVRRLECQLRDVHSPQVDLRGVVAYDAVRSEGTCVEAHNATRSGEGGPVDASAWNAHAADGDLNRLGTSKAKKHHLRHRAHLYRRPAAQQSMVYGGSGLFCSPMFQNQRRMEQEVLGTGHSVVGFNNYSVGNMPSAAVYGQMEMPPYALGYPTAPKPTSSFNEQTETAAGSLTGVSISTATPLVNQHHYLPHQQSTIDPQLSSFPSVHPCYADQFGAPYSMPYAYASFHPSSPFPSQIEFARFNPNANSIQSDGCTKLPSRISQSLYPPTPEYKDNDPHPASSNVLTSIANLLHHHSIDNNNQADGSVNTMTLNRVPNRGPTGGGMTSSGDCHYLANHYTGRYQPLMRSHVDFQSSTTPEEFEGYIGALDRYGRPSMKRIRKQYFQPISTPVNKNQFALVPTSRISESSAQSAVALLTNLPSRKTVRSNFPAKKLTRREEVSLVESAADRHVPEDTPAPKRKRVFKSKQISVKLPEFPKDITDDLLIAVEDLKYYRSRLPLHDVEIYESPGTLEVADSLQLFSDCIWSEQAPLDCSPLGVERLIKDVSGTGSGIISSLLRLYCRRHDRLRGYEVYALLNGCNEAAKSLVTSGVYKHLGHFKTLDGRFGFRSSTTNPGKQTVSTSRGWMPLPTSVPLEAMLSQVFVRYITYLALELDDNREDKVAGKDECMENTVLTFLKGEWWRSVEEMCEALYTYSNSRSRGGAATSAAVTGEFDAAESGSTLEGHAGVGVESAYAAPSSEAEDRTTLSHGRFEKRKEKKLISLAAGLQGVKVNLSFPVVSVVHWWRDEGCVNSITWELYLRQVLWEALCDTQHGVGKPGTVVVSLMGTESREPLEETPLSLGQTLPLSSETPAGSVLANHLPPDLTKCSVDANVSEEAIASAETRAVSELPVLSSVSNRTRGDDAEGAASVPLHIMSWPVDPVKANERGVVSSFSLEMIGTVIKTSLFPCQPGDGFGWDNLTPQNRLSILCWILQQLSLSPFGKDVVDKRIEALANVKAQFALKEKLSKAAAGPKSCPILSVKEAVVVDSSPLEAGTQNTITEKSVSQKNNTEVLQRSEYEESPLNEQDGYISSVATGDLVEKIASDSSEPIIARQMEINTHHGAEDLNSTCHYSTETCPISKVSDRGDLDNADDELKCHQTNFDRCHEIMAHKLRCRRECLGEDRYMNRYYFMESTHLFAPAQLPLRGSIFVELYVLLPSTHICSEGVRQISVERHPVPIGFYTLSDVNVNETEKEVNQPDFGTKCTQTVSAISFGKKIGRSSFAVQRRSRKAPLKESLPTHDNTLIPTESSPENCIKTPLGSDANILDLAAAAAALPGSREGCDDNAGLSGREEASRRISGRATKGQRAPARMSSAAVDAEGFNTLAADTEQQEMHERHVNEHLAPVEGANMGAGLALSSDSMSRKKGRQTLGSGRRPIGRPKKEAQQAIATVIDVVRRTRDGGLFVRRPTGIQVFSSIAKVTPKCSDSTAEMVKNTSVLSNASCTADGFQGSWDRRCVLNLKSSEVLIVNERAHLDEKLKSASIFESAFLTPAPTMLNENVNDVLTSRVVENCLTRATGMASAASLSHTRGPAGSPSHQPSSLLPSQGSPPKQQIPVGLEIPASQCYKAAEGLPEEAPAAQPSAPKTIIRKTRVKPASAAASPKLSEAMLFPFPPMTTLNHMALIQWGILRTVEDVRKLTENLSPFSFRERHLRASLTALVDQGAFDDKAADASSHDLSSKSMCETFGELNYGQDIAAEQQIRNVVTVAIKQYPLIISVFSSVLAHLKRTADHLLALERCFFLALPHKKRVGVGSWSPVPALPHRNDEQSSSESNNSEVWSASPLLSSWHHAVQAVVGLISTTQVDLKCYTTNAPEDKYVNKFQQQQRYLGTTDRLLTLTVMVLQLIGSAPKVARVINSCITRQCPWGPRYHVQWEQDIRSLLWVLSRVKVYNELPAAFACMESAIAAAVVRDRPKWIDDTGWTSCEISEERSLEMNILSIVKDVALLSSLYLIVWMRFGINRFLSEHLTKDVTLDRGAYLIAIHQHCAEGVATAEWQDGAVAANHRIHRLPKVGTYAYFFKSAYHPLLATVKEAACPQLDIGVPEGVEDFEEVQILDAWYHLGTPHQQQSVSGDSSKIETEVACVRREEIGGSRVKKEPLCAKGGKTIGSSKYLAVVPRPMIVSMPYARYRCRIISRRERSDQLLPQSINDVLGQGNTADVTMMNVAQARGEEGPVDIILCIPMRSQYPDCLVDRDCVLEAVKGLSSWKIDDRFRSALHTPECSFEKWCKGRIRRMESSAAELLEGIVVKWDLAKWSPLQNRIAVWELQEIPKDDDDAYDEEV